MAVWLKSCRLKADVAICESLSWETLAPHWAALDVHQGQEGQAQPLRTQPGTQKQTRWYEQEGPVHGPRPPTHQLPYFLCVVRPFQEPLSLVTAKEETDHSTF